MTPRTSAGLLKIRPVPPGARIALVAPASPFPPDHFEHGVRELKRLGFDPVWDERIFHRTGFVAGSAELRAASLRDALADESIDAIMAVRGGYGSVQMLPFVDPSLWTTRRTAFIGYSDVTSLHTVINQQAGLVSIHGPMIDGRLSAGPEKYDPCTFLTALLDHPVGDVPAPAAEVLIPGPDVRGPIFGGTLSLLTASLGTPYAFDPPAGSILFLDDVGERPFRIDRMLTHLRLAGVFARAAAIVFNEMPGCDEPDGRATARGAIADALDDFPGPVLFGVPSGHADRETVTLPFGVQARVLTGRAGLLIEEAAACA